MADFNIPQLRNRKLSALLENPSVMDNYQPRQQGLLDPAADAIGPPTVLGGLLSLDPTDYVGPQTIGKLAAGLKGLLAGGAAMPLMGGVIKRQPLYHGTADIFDSFDVSKAGTRMKSDWGKGVYFDPSPVNANSYRIEALKNSNQARNDAFARYEELSKNTPVVNGSPQYSQEAMDALREFQRISREIDKGAKGGSVMRRYLRDDAKVAEHYIEPGSITDPFLGDNLRQQGYDAVKIMDRLREDGAVRDRLSEVLVMNPNALTKSRK